MQHHRHPNSMPRLVPTNAEFERGCAIAKQLIKTLGLDPNKFDELTKKQKHAVVNGALGHPYVCAARKNTVPPSYVKMIRNDLMRFLRTEYFTSAEGVGITLWDIATDGLAFTSRLCSCYERGAFTGLPQEAFVAALHEKLKNDVLYAFMKMRIGEMMQLVVNSLSQVNYRFYAFTCDFETLQVERNLRLRVTIGVHECQSRYFIHNGVRRIAYKVEVKMDDEQAFLQRINIKGAERYLPLLRKDIIPNDPNGEREVEVYIQSHALHRFKERINMMHPRDRNGILYVCLVSGRRIVQGRNRPLLACSILSCIAGYFSFFMSGDNVVVSTFLPIVSPETPEGRRLQRVLRLTKDECSYLGMDKLDFFYHVDFEQIPLLKNALEEAGIYPLIPELRKFARENVRLYPALGIKQDRTHIVAQFFEKWQATLAERSAYDDDIRAAEEEQIQEWMMPGAEERGLTALDAAMQGLLDKVVPEVTSES